VSSAKFATITANLLARKGDAAPSVVAPVKVPSRPTLVPRDDQPLASEPRQQDKPKSCVALWFPSRRKNWKGSRTAVIKIGTNRHDIVRAALHDYFRKLSAELPYPCACMEAVRAVPPRQAETTSAHPSYPVSVENLDSAISAMETAENRL